MKWLHRTKWWRAIRLASRRPTSRTFGFDRGQPIDRYYIEGFLRRHAADIAGRVLEIGSAEYTKRIGGTAVTRSEVLHATPGNPDATIVGDLSTGRGIENEAFDCIILTQTLPFIYGYQGAVSHAFRALRPGGVVLATVPGISQISRYDMDRWGDFWRFTSASARRLFEEVFGKGHVDVDAHGNVLVACAFLHGLASHELARSDLDYRDLDYEVIVTVRAHKPCP